METRANSKFIIFSKILLKSIRVHLNVYVLLVLFVLMSTLFFEELETFLGKFWIDPIVSRFYQTSYTWILIVLFVLCEGFFYYRLYENKKKISNLHLLIDVLYLILYITLGVKSDWVYQSLTGGSKWFALSNITLLPVIINLICYLYSRFTELYNCCVTKIKCDEEKLKFSIERVKGVQDFYGRKEYSDHLFSILKNSFYPDSAFSICISGPWGSGKTTFLEFLKVHKNDPSPYKINFIDFDPWRYETSEAIISGFFNVLERNFGSVPNISAMISKYSAELLANIDTVYTRATASIFKILAFRDNQNTDLYDDICRSLKDNPHPTVVFIDDIDRLTVEEVKSVLHLIRNSANFPYLQFVVSYDKAYITSLLKTEIEHPEEYLKKFFNVEICLPKYESRVILEQLNSQLQQMLQICSIHGIEVEGLYSVGVDNNIIVGILKNIRDVVRFSNSFITNLGYIEKTGNREEFFLSDLFYLELIKYESLELYTSLKDDPLKYLSHKEENYIFDSSKIDSDISPFCIKLLDYLFNVAERHDGVKMFECFDRYFMLRLDNSNLSKTKYWRMIGYLNPKDFSLSQFEEMYREYGAEQFSYYTNMMLASVYNQEVKLDYHVLYYSLARLLETNDDRINLDIATLIKDHLELYKFLDLNHFKCWLDLLNNAYVLAIFDFQTLLQNLLPLQNFKSFLTNDKTELSQYGISLLTFLKNVKLPKSLISDMLSEFIKDNSNVLDDKSLLISFGELSQLKLDFFLNYNKGLDKEFMDLYEECVDNDKKEINKEAIDLMKSTIEKYPSDFMGVCVRERKHTESEIIRIDMPYDIMRCFGKNNSEFEENFDSFIHKYRESPYYVRLRNFWQLYKTNDFSFIEIKTNKLFEEILANNLTELVFEQERLESIEQDVNLGHRPLGSGQMDYVFKVNDYRQMYKAVFDSPLHVALRDRLLERIRHMFSL